MGLENRIICIICLINFSAMLSGLEYEYWVHVQVSNHPKLKFGDIGNAPQK